MTLRTHGDKPYTVAVLHGGPGAPGEVYPLANSLAVRYGVLEPMQSAKNIAGQIEELKAQLVEHASLPVTLIGHSYGAWLAYMFAAKHPKYVRKLILVSSGVFEQRYVDEMNTVRGSRLKPEEDVRMGELFALLRDSDCENKADVLKEFGTLVGKADAYEAISDESHIVDYLSNVYRCSMNDLNTLRRSGELVDIGRDICCPVIAIHGEDDSHPWRGVKEPLERVIPEFRFELLPKCGHYPWNERYARDDFYSLLIAEIQ